jgi:hypothetical protein
VKKSAKRIAADKLKKVLNTQNGTVATFAGAGAAVDSGSFGGS